MVNSDDGAENQLSHPRADAFDCRFETLTDCWDSFVRPGFRTLFSPPCIERLRVAVFADIARRLQILDRRTGNRLLYL